MANTSHDVDVLNDLIATTIDSANGYEEAAKDAESGRFKELFSARASERHGVAADLQAAVVAAGGDPKESGTLLAAAHRVFVNLRNALSSGDEAVVAEVERGEDHIKAKYEDAVADTALSPQARGAITKAYASVRAGHDQMSAIKHSMNAR
ncbi:PA2169 family four-helix-bundle protein [Zavarzinia sp. CC-PAN008]|uniref:PA2169 family four-helix-bundle protein n=1 Tax=Zavarzinia sp. CC-PAN008 TaxID=3243332 RepID=UPI003F7474C9